MIRFLCFSLVDPILDILANIVYTPAGLSDLFKIIISSGGGRGGGGKNGKFVPVGKIMIYITRIFEALTGPKILAGTAPIKVGSARLVLVDLVACFEFLSAAVTQQRLYQICDGKT